MNYVKEQKNTIKAIFKSTELALQFSGIDNFKDTAESIYTYMKHKLLSETFECNESDTQEVIGEIQKVKSKKTVKQNEK